jgi:hypothetical protein
MSEGTSNNGAKSVYPADLWPEARSLYEGGLSLQGVAGKLGMPYSTVRYHAWTEDWGVRSRGGQQDPRYQAAKAKQMRRKLEEEEKRLEQELALFSTFQRLCGELLVGLSGRYCSPTCRMLMAEFYEFYTLRFILENARWAGAHA